MNPGPEREPIRQRRGIDSPPLTRHTIIPMAAGWPRHVTRLWGREPGMRKEIPSQVRLKSQPTRAMSPSTRPGPISPEYLRWIENWLCPNRSSHFHVYREYSIARRRRPTPQEFAIDGLKPPPNLKPPPYPTPSTKSVQCPSGTDRRSTGNGQRPVEKLFSTGRGSLKLRRSRGVDAHGVNLGFFSAPIGASDKTTPRTSA
jgi:hypothetical protein